MFPSLGGGQSITCDAGRPLAHSSRCAPSCLQCAMYAGDLWQTQSRHTHTWVARAHESPPLDWLPTQLPTPLATGRRDLAVCRTVENLHDATSESSSHPSSVARWERCTAVSYRQSVRGNMLARSSQAPPSDTSQCACRSEREEELQPR